MWTKLTNPGVGGGLFIEANPSGVVYALGRTGIASTIDGISWTDITLPSLVGEPHNRLVFNSLGEPICSIDGKRGGTPSGLYRYTNGSWVKGICSPTITQGYILALASSGNNLIAITEHNDCYRSIDNGATWTRIATAIATGGVGYIAKTGPDGGVWIGGEYGASGPGILKSIDGGLTWQGMGLSNGEGWKHNLIGIAFDLNGNTLAGKDNAILGLEILQNGVWTTIDGGLPHYAATMDIQVHPISGGILLLQKQYNNSQTPQWSANGSTFVGIGSGLDVGVLLIRSIFHPITNDAWLIDNNGFAWSSTLS